MKMKCILLLICLNIWIISTAQAVCKDMMASFCNKNINCEQPGMDTYCEKTCKGCPDEGCELGHYWSNDSCTSCKNPPAQPSELYNQSCGGSCPKAKWGRDCDKHCNQGCKTNTCDRWTGKCRGGCKDCYHGNICDLNYQQCNCDPPGECECIDGFYGSNCYAKCNENCKSGICNMNGECQQGCKGGWYGPQCDNDCSSCNGPCARETGICEDGCINGKYNDKCDKKCNPNCSDNICGQADGKCFKGCQNKMFGDKCEGKCPTNCRHRNCSQSNGYCENGCKLGYFGDRCKNVCPVNCKGNTCSFTSGICDKGCMTGAYGEKCDMNCSINCIGETCIQMNGKCDKGCRPKWFGDQCDKLCPGNCSSVSCNGIDGSCQDCVVGYKGSHCNTTCSGHCTVCDQYGDSCSSCSLGWYGDKCGKTCNNCIDGVCNITNGYCVDGCKIGYYDSLCTTPCNAHCQERVDSIHCTRDTGSCSDGCKDGWFGDRCERECSSGCKDHRCNRTTGACSDGCIAPAYGINCADQGLVFLWVAVPSFLIIFLLVVAFLVLKRSKRKKSYNLRSGIFGSAGRCANMVSLVNPSFISTPKGSSTPNNEENFESQILTEGDKLIGVQRQADDEKKEDPFYRPARIQPHIFSSYIPCIPAEGEVGWSDDTPFPCQLPDEPQLGCVWSTEVRVEKFREYVKTMKRNLGLTNQFFDLPYGRLGPCDEGERQVNAFKNRYRNILPYDHSRVTLRYIDGIPGSDYFNANYINGYGKPRAFVASQGPYVDVLWDFWRMVWEIDTDKIVMLTNLVENRKNKCEQYWPDTGELLVNYDGVFVQCVTEKHLEDYIERTFTVQMENQPTRIVKQYHFTTWPDKGVPQDVTSLVDFHQVVKQSPASRYGPIIVHCSAGVGRTGTFLALDYLIAQAKAEGVIDVYECVTRIRHQRMDAIQTEEQYIFLHDALVEALPSGDRPSKEGTGTHKTKKRQRLNHPSKLRPESPRNPFIDQNPSWDDKRYQTSRLPDIPLETFSSLLSSTPGRRS